MSPEERADAVSDRALDADIPELQTALEERSPGFRERRDDAVRAMQTLFPKGYNPADTDGMERGADAMLREQGRMRNLLHMLGVTEHDGVDVASNPDINPLIFAHNELNSLDRMAADGELSEDEQTIRDALSARLEQVGENIRASMEEPPEEIEETETGMERPGGEEVEKSEARRS